MRTRLRVRGPDAGGGYDLFLDDNPIITGIGVQEAARYIRDAWLYGAAVFPEHLDALDGVQPILSPDLTSALQALGALPRAELGEDAQ